MKKKLLSLILAFSLITTSVAALALADHDNVAVVNHGAYVLKIKYTDPSDNQKEKKISTLRTAYITTADNTYIHLTALAGKSAHLVSKNNARILCTGTTLIGFKCKYTN